MCSTSKAIEGLSRGFWSKTTFLVRSQFDQIFMEAKRSRTSFASVLHVNLICKMYYFLNTYVKVCNDINGKLVNKIFAKSCVQIGDYLFAY